MSTFAIVAIVAVAVVAVGAVGRKIYKKAKGNA